MTAIGLECMLIGAACAYLVCEEDSTQDTSESEPSSSEDTAD